MSELERQKHQKNEVALRHIPQAVVPVPMGEVREFVQDALHGTSIIDPVARWLSGWAFLVPHLRFTAVDPRHTRIEIDVVGIRPGAETLLFVQRRAEIDRFFVAFQDELDRRNRWRPRPPAEASSIESSD